MGLGCYFERLYIFDSIFSLKEFNHATTAEAFFSYSVQSLRSHIRVFFGDEGGEGTLLFSLDSWLGHPCILDALNA